LRLGVGRPVSPLLRLFCWGRSQTDLSSSQGTLLCLCPALRPRSDLHAKPVAAFRVFRLSISTALPPIIRTPHSSSVWPLLWERSSWDGQALQLGVLLLAGIFPHYGSIQLRTGVDCSPTSRHITISRPTLHLMANRNKSDSRPREFAGRHSCRSGADRCL
jgi:hypothetical protein